MAVINIAQIVSGRRHMFINWLYRELGDKLNIKDVHFTDDGIGIIGFAINWFGDSLDGRLAYYRHRSRRWYGFSLDLTVDWLTTILIGWGYITYVNGIWEMLGYGFVAMYGWAIIITLIRYKVTGKYSIDSGLFGPTEVRIIICLILISEVLITNAIHYSAAAACILLFLVNFLDTFRLLRLADERDKEEKKTSE